MVADSGGCRGEGAAGCQATVMIYNGQPACGSCGIPLHTVAVYSHVSQLPQRTLPLSIQRGLKKAKRAIFGVKSHFAFEENLLQSFCVLKLLATKL